MGKRVPITLPNGRAWPRKRDAQEHFKDMLGRYSLGEKVTNREDISDLTALLTVYDTGRPSSKSKIGPGISHFEKRQDLENPGGSTCFFVVRTDGSSIDFSLYRAIDVAGNST